MLLGNLLLALAWTALRGEFSLANLMTGLVLGHVILLSLVKGGVLPASPYIGRVHRAVGLAAFFAALSCARTPRPLDSIPTRSTSVSRSSTGL